MTFKIPVYMPGWEPGRQIVNFGQGGPASHMQILAHAARSYPTNYAVGTYGLGGMPRQVMGPTQAINVNRVSDPLVFNNLEIAGLMKNPIGG